MAIVFYNTGKAALMNGGVDLNTDTIKAALVVGYTPNIDTHQDWADVSANEISASGYTAGGATLANSAVTVDTANDRAVWDADDVVWASLAATSISHVVLYKDTGTPATSTLIGYHAITQDSGGGDYTLQWGSPGLATLS